jgi:hypothetical protein
VPTAGPFEPEIEFGKIGFSLKPKQAERLTTILELRRQLGERRPDWPDNEVRPMKIKPLPMSCFSIPALQRPDKASRSILKARQQRKEKENAARETLQATNAA